MVDIDFGRYPRYDELVGIMKGLHEEYPGFTKLYSIGKTMEGRELWTMEVTNFETGPGEEKPGIWVDGNTHSSEPTGTNVCLKTIWHLVTEYGMTELSSQLWGTPDKPYRPPPWLRVVAVDPASATPLPPGTSGQLRFVDLCNLDGTLAIETMDAGTVQADGRVLLHGRLEGAVARGCSLTVEDVWAARGGR